MLEGRVIHGAHQQKALSARGRSRRLHPHLPGGAADRRRDRGAHRARRRRVPDPQDAEPRRLRSTGPRPTSPMLQAAAAGQRPAPVPRRPVRRVHPARRRAAQLLDGQRAAHVRSTSRGIELHLRHLPGGKFTDHVFGAMKEKDILRIEGPFGSFFLREDSDKPMVLLASGTGFAPIKAIIEHMQSARAASARPCCTGAAAARPTCTCTTGREAGDAQMPHLRYIPVLSEPKPEDDWTRPHRPRPPGGDARPPEPDRATRSMPAARRSWSSRRERDFIARCGLPDDEFYADSFTSEADKHGPLG